MKIVSFLLGVLGLIALALIIWFVTPLFSFAGYSPFESAIVRLCLLLAVFAFILIRFLIRWIRARRNNAKLIDGLVKTNSPEQIQTPSPEQSEITTLKQRFEEAVKILKESQANQAARKGGFARLLSLGSSRHLYELPWYVFIGAPGSGKTTALINSGLRFPVAEKLGTHQIKGVGGTRNCDWWFTDEAVLIDTAGRYTTQDSNYDQDSGAWKGFLDLLRKHRPRQPLNGVLLTISIGDLLSFSEEQNRRHAETLRARIQELYSGLNTRIPVYVLVTKSDLIAGFTEFFADLGKEARDQVWGVTFPLGIDTQTIGETLSAKLRALRQKIEDKTIPRLEQETDLVYRGRMITFDQQLALVDHLLEDFLKRVFTPSGFDHPLMVRGIYFTSGTQEGTPIDRVMANLGGAFGLARKIQPSQAGGGKSFFITRLLKEVVFAEQRMGGANLKWEKRRKLVRFGLFTLLGVVSLGLLLAWAISYSRNSRYIDEVETRIKTIQPLITSAQMASADDLLGIVPVLDAIRDVTLTASRTDGVPLSLRYGLFQGDKLDSAADQAYRTLLRDVFLPRITNRLESQLTNADPNNPEFAYEALKAYLMLFDSEHFDSDNVKTWISLDWESNLPEGVTPEQRNALNRHLDALFDQSTVSSSTPMNRELVQHVREQLLHYPLPDRVLNRLKRQSMGPEVPEFSLDKAIGPTAVTVFARKSGKSLTQGVPGLYTRDGYQKGFNTKLEELTKRLIAEEPWVLGVNTSHNSPEDTAKILGEIRRLYLNDYIKTWDEFIDDLKLARTESLQQSIQIARVLSAPDSPLAKLLRALSKETTLSKSASSPNLSNRAQDALNRTRTELGAMLFGGARNGAEQAAPGSRIESIVDDHYAQLRNLVTGEEKSAPINSTIQLVNDIYVFLSAVETAQRDKVTMQPSDVPARTKAESARLPEPVRSMIQQLSSAGNSQLADSLRDSLSDSVGAQVGQFCAKAIGGRYPFARNSPRDVTREDFAALFGPAGKIEDFFNKNLAQYVDMSTNTWSFKKLQEQSLGGTGNLIQFQRAATIKDVFFRTGGTLRLDFKPIEMDPAITNFVLDVDGQIVRYNHGPQMLQSVQWPGPKGGLQARIQISPPGPSGTSGATTEGPWALFRLLDKATIQPAGSPEKFLVKFAIDGRVAVFEVSMGGVQNPFRLRELAEFRCPSGL